MTPKHAVGTNLLHNALPTVGLDSSGVSPSVGRRLQAKPSLSTRLESRQPERFFTHSRHSTGPSQRLFIDKYSRHCCNP
jgi:hypothetical protein